MEKTISVRDTFVHVATKENFYHGILLGIVSYKSGWLVNSNRESGNGFSDIMIRDDAEKLGIIIEVKYAEDGQEDAECRNALRQIEVKKYGMNLHQMGVEQILNYGIACNRKRCRVKTRYLSPLRKCYKYYRTITDVLA